MIISYFLRVSNTIIIFLFLHTIIIPLMEREHINRTDRNVDENRYSCFSDHFSHYR